MVNVDAQRRGNSLIVVKGKVIFGEALFDLTANMPHFPSVDDSIINLRIAGPDIERFRYVFRLPGEATGAFSVDFIVDIADGGVEILNLDVQTSLARIEANGVRRRTPIIPIAVDARWHVEGMRVDGALDGHLLGLIRPDKRLRLHRCCHCIRAGQQRLLQPIPQRSLQFLDVAIPGPRKRQGQ